VGNDGADRLEMDFPSRLSPARGLKCEEQDRRPLEQKDEKKKDLFLKKESPSIGIPLIAWSLQQELLSLGAACFYQFLCVWFIESVLQKRHFKDMILKFKQFLRNGREITPRIGLVHEGGSRKLPRNFK